jgi:hypothetical protein
MGISVKKSIFEDLFQININQAPGYLPWFDTGCFDSRVISNFYGKHILQGKHPAGGVGPYNQGHTNVWLVFEVFLDYLCVASFVDVINLFKGDTANSSSSEGICTLLRIGR